MPNTLTAFGSPMPPRAFFVANNGGQQQTVQLYGGALEFALAPTQAVHVPGGNFIVFGGQYANLQVWDSTSLLWRFLSATDRLPNAIYSDGSNFQIVNTTGCPIGAVVTNAGSGLVNGFYGYNQALSGISIVSGAVAAGGNSYLTVTASAGGSLWNAFVGGAISTTVAITAGGSGFNEAPNLIVVPPSNQGAQPFIPASMTCTISGGAINAVTVTNQGAGYVSAPTVLVVPQESDTAANFTAAVLTPALTGSGTVTAVTNASPGTAATSANPTLAFGGTSGGGGAAATTIGNYVVVSATVAGGAGYGNAQPYQAFMIGGYSAAVPVYTNPATETAIISPTSQSILTGVSNAGGTPQTPVVRYAGYGFQTTSTMQLKAFAAAGTIPTTDATFTLTAGGQTTTLWLVPI